MSDEGARDARAPSAPVPDEPVVTLDDTVAEEWWDALSARPARDLPGLRDLMERPSPFSEPE